MCHSEWTKGGRTVVWWCASFKAAFVSVAFSLREKFSLSRSESATQPTAESGQPFFNMYA